jgi:hypothetical protein
LDGAWLAHEAGVARIDDLVISALKTLPEKPPDDAKQDQKKRYSERVSAAVALAVAQELRNRGLTGTRPTEPGDKDLSGAERRMSGGIGAKKVDVTWATEESGLVLAVSIKSINWKDKRSKNYQKNLTNRRGDMLFESVTLHRRFPYAVLVGLLFLDKGAAEDGTEKRLDTFENAHNRLRLFTGRTDPAGRDEQYEHLYILLLDATPPFTAALSAYEAGKKDAIRLEAVFDEIVRLVAERNSDFYEYFEGHLRPLRGKGKPKE